jgi:Mg2+-importing ATPase
MTGRGLQPGHWRQAERDEDGIMPGHEKSGEDTSGRGHESAAVPLVSLGGSGKGADGREGAQKGQKDRQRNVLLHYATIDAAHCLSETGSAMNGLPQQETERRLARFGRNVLVEKKRVGVIVEFLMHFRNPLVVILLMAAGVSYYLGAEVDAVIIGVIILLSLVLDFTLEHKANVAAEKLKERVVTTATVIRNGERKEVKITNICVGDIIALGAGDFVPADARVLEAKDFFVNQASLTGESLPSEKSPERIDAVDASLAELTNIVFMGTNAVSGTAMAVVVGTGKATEFGKIAKHLEAPPPENEFERGLKSFGYLIARSIIFLVLFIFLFNALARHEYLQAFIFAVAVAVGLTPDLLPMILSVTMAKGSMSMSKKGVIVKRLSSIQNFGSMDVLCTDKTGTLTQDNITLVKYTDVMGRDRKDVLLYTYVNSFFQTGIKNPLDRAVLRYEKVDTLLHALDYRKVDEIPFDFVRRRVSVVVQKGRERYMIVKGAPEEMLRVCDYYDANGRRNSLAGAGVKEKVSRQYLAFSEQGYRVLALAVKKLAGSKKTYTKDDEKGLVLLGFVAFFDPPKMDVKKVLSDLKDSGVEVKVITGDNELVTRKICQEIGLEIRGILLGSQMDRLGDEALKVRVEQATIFARFSPEQKNRVILALRANGHTVGYLGDGINDAPSLKNADVGISVNTAVDVAKESAEIILTHKSLGVLHDGVIEGRKTFANTMKYMMMGISSNFGNMISVTGAILFLPFLPMLPVQILLNNLIYDFSQTTIPADNVDREFVEKPRKLDIAFIRHFMIMFGTLSSLFDYVTFILLYAVFRLPAAFFQTGWFLESLTTQVMVVHIIRTKKVPVLQSRSGKLLVLSTVACVLVGWLIPYSRLGKLFGFVALPAGILGALGAIVIAYLLAVEFAKRKFYHKYNF